MRASEKAYKALKEEILEWRLMPGAELSEVEQSQRLGVSRTPLREALRRLEAENLVVLGKGRTLVVAELSISDVRGLFQLREALETQAARLAALGRNPELFSGLATRFGQMEQNVDSNSTDLDEYYALVAELDSAIDSHMASPYLQRALRNVRLHVARARKLARDQPERLRAAAAEHRMICLAIAEGDQILAAQSTAVHLANSLKSILETLQADCPEDQPGAQL